MQGRKFPRQQEESFRGSRLNEKHRETFERKARDVGLRGAAYHQRGGGGGGARRPDGGNGRHRPDGRPDP